MDEKLYTIDKEKNIKIYTLQNWKKEGERLFGTKDMLQWWLVCPQCGTPQKTQEIIDAGLTEEEAMSYIGFSCIGRFTKGQGCDWTLEGLFQIHKVEISHNGEFRQVFDFYQP